MWLHVRATAAFGLSFLVLLVYLVRARDRVGRLLHGALALLGLLVVQMAVGEIQWRNELPWWLVLVHVGLAAAVWAWTVGLVDRPLAAAGAAARAAACLAEPCLAEPGEQQDRDRAEAGQADGDRVRDEEVEEPPRLG